MTASAQLTPKQITVLEALLTGASVTAAARAAGVHRCTIHEWLSLTPFRCAYDDAQRRRAEAIEDQVHDMANSALDAVRALLSDANTPAAIRLRAALAVIEKASDAGPALRRLNPNARRTAEREDLYYDAVYNAAYSEAVHSAQRHQARQNPTESDTSAAAVGG